MIATNVDAQTGITRITVSGVFELGDLVKSWRAHASAVDAGSIMRVLWDLRQADWAAAASEFEMLNLRETNARFATRNLRIFAFLFASQSETAIADIYQSDLQRICVPRFFHYEPDALAWLASH